MHLIRKHLITWIVMLDLQGPSKRILFITKFFPYGNSKIGDLSSLHASFHAFKNAFFFNKQGKKIKQITNQLKFIKIFGSLHYMLRTKFNHITLYLSEMIRFLSSDYQRFLLTNLMFTEKRDREDIT